MTGSLLPAGGGRVVRDTDKSSAVIKAALDELALVEFRYSAGQKGPDRHVHHHHTDAFYVLEGELTVTLGDGQSQLGRGGYALVPPGTPHTFSNPSDSAVRALNLMAPGGFEQYLKEVARAVPPDGSPDPQLMAEIASRYDFHPAQ